jgi:hypothetical protein
MKDGLVNVSQEIFVLLSYEEKEMKVHGEQKVKKEMQMLPNGNYEEVISPIQHHCSHGIYTWNCIEYGYDLGKLHLSIVDGDPYEDGYEAKIIVNFCPFCGYKPIEKGIKDTISFSHIENEYAVFNILNDKGNKINEMYCKISDKKDDRIAKYKQED